ncbi:class I SAM-dependent methyltransferase [Hoeflea sp.]|uniref:class I SAM-dependent methyltransferase n=1 Tax=Hoeflea sp. TaxID=1940281 RepID=UPI00199A6641|nr:class I SAM-dependent methyltransferase [Hoeflea sp.]MBC7284274.1 class I SAM-dependent methyltransferase [Hoeflea sp.]
MDEYIAFMFSLPNPAYPNLSKLLPPMASEAVQMMFTGQKNEDLRVRTIAFIRAVERMYFSSTNRSMAGTTTLDIGFGYGRFLRVMPWFTDIQNMYGIDPWDGAHNECAKTKVFGTLVRSDQRPEQLAFDENKFDLAFAYSVFTHLTESTAQAMFEAVRRVVKPEGVFFLTVRPEEYWQMRDDLRHTKSAKGLIEQHRSKGFAFEQEGPHVEHYGNASISLDYLKRLENWDFIAYDWTYHDPWQMVVALKPRK